MDFISIRTGFCRPRSDLNDALHSTRVLQRVHKTKCMSHSYTNTAAIVKWFPAECFRTKHSDRDLRTKAKTMNHKLWVMEKLPNSPHSHTFLQLVSIYTYDCYEHQVLAPVSLGVPCSAPGVSGHGTASSNALHCDLGECCCGACATCWVSGPLVRTQARSLCSRVAGSLKHSLLTLSSRSKAVLHTLQRLCVMSADSFLRSRLLIMCCS